MSNVDKNTVFDITQNLFVKSNTDGLYVMPWKFLHDGYEVTRQSTVVRVDPDAGLPISHSRFTVGGRIISAKLYIDREETFWFWYGKATRSSALPFWAYDAKLNGYMRCLFTDEPSLSPAGNSVKGMYAQIKVYCYANPVQVIGFVMEDTPEKYVTEQNNYVIEDADEVSY